MPPSYKPRPIPQGMLPQDLFQSDGMMSLDQAQALHAQERARELALEAQEMNFEEKQRLLAQEEAQREKLKAEFGPRPDGTEPEFDPDKAWNIVEKLAIQNGDIKTATEVARARRILREERILTDEEAITMGVPPGTTLQVAHAMLRAKDLNDRQSRFFDPTQSQIRDQNLTLKEQQATGTQYQKISDSELTKIQSSEGSMATIGEVNSLLDQLDPGALSALKAGKVTDLYKDPGSPAYRMYANLDLLKKQVARMNDSGALTQLDVEMFAPLTAGSPIYDSKESVRQRMDDLARYISRKKQSVIETNEKAYRNMDRFKDSEVGLDVAPDSFKIPTTSGAGNAGGLTPEEAAYKEQYKQKLRAQRGG